MHHSVHFSRKSSKQDYNPHKLFSSKDTLEVVFQQVAALGREKASGGGDPFAIVRIQVVGRLGMGWGP